MANQIQKQDKKFALGASIIAALIPIVCISNAEVKPSQGWVIADIVMVVLMIAVSWYVFALDKTKLFIGVIAYFVLAGIIIFKGCGGSLG